MLILIFLSLPSSVLWTTVSKSFFNQYTLHQLVYHMTLLKLNMNNILIINILFIFTITVVINFSIRNPCCSFINMLLKIIDILSTIIFSNNQSKVFDFDIDL